MSRHLGLTFTDELAQAVADGRKTQTRRPMKPQPPAEFRGPTAFPLAHLAEPLWAFGLPGPNIVTPGPCWPPGDEPGIKPHLPGSGIARVGDLLWVREAFNVRRERDDTVITERLPKHPSPEWLAAHRVYLRAVTATADGPWRPSIHMPKWACRTWARITAVYPERVADISEADAMAEGVEKSGGHRCYPSKRAAMVGGTYRQGFLDAYRDIYGSTDGWCWVVKFERCDALVHALDSRTGQQWTYDGGGEYRTLTRSVGLLFRPHEVWVNDGKQNHAVLPLSLDAWELAESVAATLEKWGGKTTGTIDNDNATLPGVG